MHYKKLDIELDPIGQGMLFKPFEHLLILKHYIGFEENGYDLITVMNVIHATTDITNYSFNIC